MNRLEQIRAKLADRQEWVCADGVPLDSAEIDALLAVAGAAASKSLNDLEDIVRQCYSESACPEEAVWLHGMLVAWLALRAALAPLLEESC